MTIILDNFFPEVQTRNEAYETLGNTRSQYFGAASLWLHIKHQVIRNAALGAWGEGSDLIL